MKTTTPKTLLIAGDFEYYIYERTTIEAINRIGGYEVEEFHFKNFIGNKIAKIERYLVFIGVFSFAMNVALLLKVLRQKPDVVLIWRGVLIHPLTPRLIKKYSKTTLVSYNNDDPFSIYYKKNLQKVPLKTRINQKRIWTFFVRGLPHYDQNFVYREKNIAEYKAAGAKSVNLFTPYYIPSQLPEKQQDEKIYDVLFIGHYENDVRAECINLLLQNGIDVTLYGTGWNKKALCNMQKISIFAHQKVQK